jgi:hypothetical protein
MAGTLQLPITGTFSGLTEQGYINTANAALATMNQSATAPTTASTGLSSMAGTWWHDTGHGVIFLRDAADANWLPVFYVDETGHLVGTTGQAGAWATVTGTANAIVVTYPVAPAAYVRGLKMAFKATANNTAATTVNGINVFRKTAAGPAACAGGEIHINDLVELEHDGTQWQIISALPVTGGTVTSIADATNGGVTVTGGTGSATIALAPTDLVAKTAPVGTDVVVIGDNAASGAPKKSTIAQIRSGSPAQIVATETGAVATGTTLIPYDDTIPQNTEGDQYMSLAITPTNASSTLFIQIVAFFASPLSSGGDNFIAAVFQDSTANALAAGIFGGQTSNAPWLVTFTHKMTAGTTSATTFKLRAGTHSSNGGLTFNGSAGGRLLGGVMASSITITEVLP